MTVTAVTASSAMGYVESTSGSYSSALSGANLSAQTGVPLTFVGQSVSSGVYFIWQAMVSFAWTADADATPVAAYFRWRNDQSTGTGIDRIMEMRAFDWGASVGAGDWRTPAQLNSATRRARIEQVNKAGSQFMRAGLGGDGLATLDSSATLRYVVNSSRNRSQSTPSSLEWNSVRSPDHTAGPAPSLWVTATTKHLLDLSLGAQAQLSDGTHILLVADDTAGTDVRFDLVHHDGTSPTTAFVGGLSSGRRGAQAYAMCRDDADNVYVINRSGAHNTLNCRVFIKGSGYSWTAGTIRQATLPTYEGDINNVATAWHPQGGAAGTIVTAVGHEAGPNVGTETAYALVNCDHLLTGSGSVLRSSGNAVGTLIDASAPGGYNSYTNESGTLLDVVRTPGDTARGFVTSTARHQSLSANSHQSIARYVLNNTGTGFTSTSRNLDTTSGFSVKDADAKSRVLPISPSQCATVNVSSSTEFGIVVKHRQNTGTSSEWTVLADVRLDAQGMSTMPAASTLSTSSAWDAVYDPASNKVWIYYFDTGDAQRLMRTHVDLDTGLAGQDEIEVDAAVGAAGGTQHAVRVHRGELEGQQVLITVANESSGGTHSLIAVVDQLNLPPEQPTLATEPNFDATAAATFEWAFEDPNPSDTQSAFQLEIYNDTTDVLEHDTTKTASGTESYTLTGGTIANDESWRWRVKTWDAEDAEGEWSNFSYFATSASGNVTIVDPASDNEAGIVTADITIQWDVTGATQDDYRVVVIKTEDESTHSDSGWVTAADVTYEITGLLSETEYRAEVTIRDTAVESSTGTRLITPDYTSPDQPSVTAVGVDDDPTSDNPDATGAYIQVSVTNPEPGVDISGLDGTFETGVSGWDVFDGTLEQSDEQAYLGTYSAKLTVTGTPTQTYFRAGAADRSPVEPNKRYTLRFWSYSPDGWSDLARAVDWFDDDDNYLTTTAEGPITVGVDTWEEHEYTATAPLGAAEASYGPTLASNPTTGLVAYFDEMYLYTAADTPTPSTNRIYRRRADTSDDYLLIASIDPNSSYRDYLTASGVTYEYYARAIADTAFADSDTTTASAAFHGLWLHDPDDAEGTIRRYLHGRAQRSYNEQVQQSTMHFAGRTQPVTLFGEHRTDTFQVTVDVPEGAYATRTLDSLRDWHRGRDAVVVRDNRGRVMVSTLDGYSEDDQAWGTQVAFTATRVDAPDVVGGEG